MTLLPTICAFCQFAMVKCYKVDEITMVIILRWWWWWWWWWQVGRWLCYAGVLQRLWIILVDGCCRESEEMGEVRPNHSYSCHLLVFRGIWALSPLSSSWSPKPSSCPTFYVLYRILILIYFLLEKLLMLWPFRFWPIMLSQNSATDRRWNRWGELLWQLCQEIQGAPYPYQHNTFSQRVPNYLCTQESLSTWYMP